MISIGAAAQQSKVLNYADLMVELDMQSVRELEDLIIDCIYNELVEGKLDQLNKRFHVVSCFGRDLRPSEIEGALAKLEAWDRQLQEAQAFVEGEVVKACNNAMVQNYERQLKESEDVAKARERVLQEMTSSGHQKKGKASGIMGMMPGFLR